MKAAKALRETSRWCSTSNSVATAKKFTQYDLVKKSWCNCNEISTTLLNIRLFLGFILCSLASSSTAVGLLSPPIDTSGGGSAVQPPHVPSGVPVRSPRSRPRANSKGQLGALEPIQERRRGSNTTSSLHADVAAALAAPSTVSEDEEDEDDRPQRSAMPPAGRDAFVVVEPAAPVAMAASVGEKQSALSTLDFSSTEPPGEHTLNLAATVAAADAGTSNSGGSSPVPGQAAATRQVAGSVKSVSFSATNQTLQPDNTIRNSSTRMEIVPAAASAVNALMLHNKRTVSASLEDYSIQRYAIMPLSPTAGLISWLPNYDTLHDLIRGYRESRKIMLNVENKLILQVAPNKMYDALPVMQKLEVSVCMCWYY